MTTDGITVTCLNCDEIHFQPDECKLRNRQFPVLNSLCRGDDTNKWEINGNKWEISQAKQTLLMYNNPRQERLDLSCASQQNLGGCQKQWSPSTNENLKKNINIIQVKTGKSFDLCLEAYYMSKNIKSAIRMLN
jgi:hypothetical protein